MQLIDNDVTKTVFAWAARLSRPKRRAAVLALLIVCLGAAPLSFARLGGDQPTEPTGALEASTGPTSDRDSQAASRSKYRLASPSVSNSPSTAAPAATASPKSGASKAAKPVQVAGLSPLQTSHAKTIVAVGQKLKLPRRAYVVAIATAMQESNLRNLANWNLSQSLSIKHDGTGGDFDSVGLFQQRPASGWGSISELMDPATSARKFYEALVQVPNWDTLPVAVAAQEVQRSAFPYAYAQHQDRAETVVDALT